MDGDDREPKSEFTYDSCAKGNDRNGSDIDLRLLWGDELNLSILAQILIEIDDLLLPYTLD